MDKGNKSCQMIDIPFIATHVQILMILNILVKIKSVVSFTFILSWDPLTHSSVKRRQNMDKPQDII